MTKEITVYRWEMPRGGYGPYREAQSWLSLESSPDPEVRDAARHLHGMYKRHNRQTLEQHPTPNTDRLDVHKRLKGDASTEWFCGFVSLAQMNKWFTKKNQEAMALCGLKLTRYKAQEAHVQVGASQALFVRSKARKVR